jgi:hypothetical protein
LKDSALAAEDKAADYFNELKTKGGDALKEYLPKMEEFLGNIFNSGKTAAKTAADDVTAAP